MATKENKGSNIEGYKKTEKSRKRIGGGKIIKEKETFINNNPSYDNMQIDRVRRTKLDKYGNKLSTKTRESERKTASSPANSIGGSRVIKYNKKGEQTTDRPTIISVKKGVAYRKTGGMVNPNKVAKVNPKKK